MKKILLISLVITLFSFGFAISAKAAVPEACRTTARQTDCVACVAQEGTWLKVPIPIVFNPTIQGGNLKEMTFSGRCILNPAILMFMLYYLALALMAVVSVVVLMFGGYSYLTSLGSAERTKDAKSRMFYAIGGLILGLLSYLIVGFINPDFTTLHWGTGPVRRATEQALQNIERRDVDTSKKCDAGSSAACQNKREGDICETLPGVDNGYCKKDANVKGCACVKDPCADQCQGGDICKGKKCTDPIDLVGQCAGNPVVCKSTWMICGDDCGDSAGFAMDCFAEKCKTGGKDGVCFSWGTSGNVQGQSFCQSLEILCASDCGYEADSYYSGGLIAKECNQIVYGEDGYGQNLGVCFAGTQIPWSSTSTNGLPGTSCDSFSDVGKACRFSSGCVYGICSIDGICNCSEAVP